MLNSYTDGYAQKQRMDSLLLVIPREEEGALETKACLGVTWAVQYPENQFKYFREKIVSVPWEKYDNLKKCFGKLGDL